MIYSSRSGKNHNSLFMPHTSHKRGFTLIEMLVVIAIISVLAGVVLTGVTGFQANARDTRRIGDLKNTQNFLELYFVKCGHYPGGYSGGACTTTAPANWVALKTMMEAAPFSISNFPKDPVTARNYEYGVENPENLKYVLKASLERDNRVLDDDVDTIPFTATPSVMCGPDTTTNHFYCITP
ncbi:MAG TPA: prepilin-type N-terminal cleavage/methylation domain-containing protein [Candidatus Paceibacterota bacterium]